MPFRLVPELLTLNNTLKGHTSALKADRVCTGQNGLVRIELVDCASGRVVLVLT